MIRFSLLLLSLLVFSCNAATEGDLSQWTCPCLNGFCVAFGDDRCTCDEGWSGYTCEIEHECLQHCDFGECDSNMVCRCEYGYRGKFCNVTDEDPCANCVNGWCNSQGYTFCHCDVGWKGVNCDVSMPLLTEASVEEILSVLDQKLELQEQNLLACNWCPGVNAYCMPERQCGCQPGWTGPQCEERIPCHEHCDFGWCDQDAVCHCNQGYEGEFCDTPKRDACVNNCVHGHCDYRNNCVCSWQWTGPTCNTTAPDQ